MAALLLATRGTPQMYYGEEIGMRTTDPKRIEDVHDPIGRMGWPEEKGRDGERTPMQWDTSAKSGFTTGKPWLPIPPSAPVYNVAVESNKPDSIYQVYKHLLALRKSDAALRDGNYESIDVKDDHVFAFRRSVHAAAGDETVIVALNMSAEPRTIAIDAGGSGEVLYRSPSSASSDPTRLTWNRVTLEPFGFVLAKVR
jgi:alpha-glucosidase